MTRCFHLASAALLVGATLTTPAAAQSPRNFPQTALRGEMVVVAPPDITMDGLPLRLAPGARIRGGTNMIVLSGGLLGQKLTVNYTVEFGGLVKDVWLLRPEEQARQPWPRTPEESQVWAFDPFAQTWTKP